ncbi:MAG TPA: recombination regulator RecX [Burkholderiaceae bacterium]|nr:recombination regulator RecX [Burkholderiaceae bacterium]
MRTPKWRLRSRTEFVRTRASRCGVWPSLRSRSATQAEGKRARATKSLLSRAITLLARRDHSRAELSRKLARYLGDDGAAELEHVLGELSRNGLLSDERFAAAVARSRSQRFGDARIRYDLRRFGVADDLSAAALANLVGSETARAREVRSKRFSARPTSAAERARQARFLQSRGFSLDAIYQVLRNGTDPE